jgi:hypothetical protein
VSVPVATLYAYSVPNGVLPHVAALTVEGGKAYTLLESEDVEPVAKLLKTLGTVLDVEPRFLPSFELARRR